MRSDRARETRRLSWDSALLISAAPRRRRFELRRQLAEHALSFIFAVGAISGLLLTVTILFEPLEGRGFVALLDILPIPAYLAASMLAALASSRSPGRRRVAWWMLASAFFIYAAGDATWAVYEVGFGVEPPVPSFADAFYLAVMPLLFAGIMLLSTSARTPGHFRTGLDAVLTVLALAAVVWDAVLQPTLASAETGLAGTLVTAAYPAGDSGLPRR